MTDITITISVPSEGATAAIKSTGIDDGPSPLNIEDLLAEGEAMEAAAPPGPVPVEEIAEFEAEMAPPPPLSMEHLEAGEAGFENAPGPESEVEILKGRKGAAAAKPAKPKGQAKK